MHRYIIRDQHATYTRIHKTKARKLLASGATNIAICPSDLRPGYPIASHMTMLPNVDFDKATNEFNYYNCQYSSKSYPAYYLVEERKN